MRGFNQGATIPKRNLANVRPMRFNLIVKLHPEKEESTYIVMPDSAKRVRDTTRGWTGTVMAVGEAIPRMRKITGKIKKGTVCLFDESVSIDDPNRCFDWEDDRFVMFDVETVMGILTPPKSKFKAGDVSKKALRSNVEMLGDRVLVRRPLKEDFKITQNKLWVPVGNETQDRVGGVVIATGPGLYNPERNRYLPMDFNVGDFVLFPKYGGTDINIDGIEYAVIRQDKILATVEGEAERIKFA